MRTLRILPFDHRASIEKGLFGIQGRDPSLDETVDIRSAKRIIWEGFREALLEGAPTEGAGVLVDERFGADILREARNLGVLTACPVERSGQDEFDFEYGADFGKHIEATNPDYVKALVHFNPEGNVDINLRQQARLARLSDFCRFRSKKLMVELLVPPLMEQLARVMGDVERFETELRPGLAIQAMARLQRAGVEPAVWKLEGFDCTDDCEQAVNQARSATHRAQVDLIVLGHGANEPQVRRWLTAAAPVEGYAGFAIGRTVFWDALTAWHEGLPAREAARTICENYRALCQLWERGRFRANLSECRSS